MDTDDPVGHGGQGGVVGDDDDGHAGFSSGVLQKTEDGLAGLVVQSAGGLIAEQELGVLCQGSGDGDALLLAAGELTGEILHSVAQTHVPEHLLRVQGIGADLVGQLHILQSGQVAHQIVKLEHKAHILPAVLGELPLVQGGDLPSVQPDGSGGQGVHAAQDVQQGGLARAGGADDDHQFALFHGEAGIVEGMDGHLAHVIGFGNIFKFNERHKHHSKGDFYYLSTEKYKIQIILR